jgi:hypothetical protein
MEGGSRTVAMFKKPKFLKRKSILHALGVDTSRWSRIICYRECMAFLDEIDSKTLDAVEISGDGPWRDRFKSFTTVAFPDYDVCEGPLPRTFDVVIADQVWPHVLWPYRATRNVLAMLNDGGWFLVTVPFLIHRNQPVDCTRWTETGLRHLLMEAGFRHEDIRSGSWGNLAAVRASLRRIGAKRHFGSLVNDPRYPMTIWAMARKPPAA